MSFVLMLAIEVVLSHEAPYDILRLRIWSVLFRSPDTILLKISHRPNSDGVRRTVVCFRGRNWLGFPDKSFTGTQTIRIWYCEAYKRLHPSRRPQTPINWGLPHSHLYPRPHMRSSGDLTDQLCKCPIRNARIRRNTEGPARVHECD